MAQVCCRNQIWQLVTVCNFMLCVYRTEVLISSHGGLQQEADKRREGQELPHRVCSLLVRQGNGLRLRLPPASTVPRHRPLPRQVDAFNDPHCFWKQLMHLVLLRWNSTVIFVCGWLPFAVDHHRTAHIPMDAWQVSLDHVSKPVDRSALYFCGFPTLQHIKHKVGMCITELLLNCSKLERTWLNTS